MRFAGRARLGLIRTRASVPLAAFPARARRSPAAGRGSGRAGERPEPPARNPFQFLPRPAPGPFQEISMSDSDSAIRCLPLKSLIPSPLNVRKTPAEGAAFEQLKASHRCPRPAREPSGAARRSERATAPTATRSSPAAGACRPCGSWRRRGLSPRIIPCPATCSRTGTTPSSSRSSKTPCAPLCTRADQVEAFAEIARDGGTVAEIAARFGVSERTGRATAAPGQCRPGTARSLPRGRDGTSGASGVLASRPIPGCNSPCGRN